MRVDVSVDVRVLVGGCLSVGACRCECGCACMSRWVRVDVSVDVHVDVSVDVRMLVGACV